MLHGTAFIRNNKCYNVPLLSKTASVALCRSYIKQRTSYGADRCSIEGSPQVGHYDIKTHQWRLVLERNPMKRKLSKKWLAGVFLLIMMGVGIFMSGFTLQPAWAAEQELMGENAGQPQLKVTYDEDKCTVIHAATGGTEICFENIGDTQLTVDSVTVDNTDYFCFKNDSAGYTAVLAPGEVGVCNLILEGADAGEHLGTVTVAYTPEGQGQKTIECPVVLQVEKKIISTVDNTEIIPVRQYNGTKNIKIVSAGEPNNVHVADDLTLNAKAEYDTENAGRNKIVTVTYSLSGKDKDNYELKLTSAKINDRAADRVVSDCCVETDSADERDWAVDRADRGYKFMFPDLFIGEDPMLYEKAFWVGRPAYDDAQPEYWYKKSGWLDSTYKKELPEIPGTYTIKAVFPGSENWNEYTVTEDFEISSLMKEGKKSLMKEATYMFGSGSWRVKGDCTVYHGNHVFCVPEDAEYEFIAN